jgi:hypothetical protein
VTLAAAPNHYRMIAPTKYEIVHELLSATSSLVSKSSKVDNRDMLLRRFLDRFCDEPFVGFRLPTRGDRSLEDDFFSLYRLFCELGFEGVGVVVSSPMKALRPEVLLDLLLDVLLDLLSLGVSSECELGLVGVIVVVVSSPMRSFRDLGLDVLLDLFILFFLRDRSESFFLSDLRRLGLAEGGGPTGRTSALKPRL